VVQRLSDTAMAISKMLEECSADDLAELLQVPA
jgi:hypothetical protein